MAPIRMEVCSCFTQRQYKYKEIFMDKGKAQHKRPSPILRQCKFMWHGAFQAPHKDVLLGKQGNSIRKACKFEFERGEGD